jgi:hypothetical protein
MQKASLWRHPKHCRAREHVVALRWLARLRARRPGDAALLSRLGYVQLCLGDLQAAAQTFQEARATARVLKPS